MIDHSEYFMHFQLSKIRLLATLLLCSMSPLFSAAEQISLTSATILVDPSEPTYVQNGAKDIGTFLGEVTGKPVLVSSEARAAAKAKTVIAVGEKMAHTLGADLSSAAGLGKEGSIIRSARKGGITSGKGE